VAEGRFYDWQDEAEGRRVVFLGSDTKKQLFGTRNALGETIEIRGIPYVVIGVMREKEQSSSYDGFDVRKVFIPFSSMMRDLPNAPPKPANSVDRLLVVPKSWEEHEACKLQVRRTLARLHDFDPRDKEAAGIWDTVLEAKANEMIVGGMKYFLGAVGVTTLFLGGIGVMDVMLVAVRERTQGRRRHTPRHPRSIFRGDSNRRVFERRGGHGHWLWVLRPGQQHHSHAAVFRRPPGRLEDRAAGFCPARQCGDSVGDVSGPAGRRGRSDRSASLRGGRIVVSCQQGVGS